MDSKITRLIEQASVIVGALPYLQAYRDKTFLIKFGGSAMDDTRLVKKLMRDIVLLEVLGFNPVIVPRLRRQGRRHSRHGNLRWGTHP